MLKKISEHPVIAGLLVLGLGSTTVLAFFTQFFAWLWLQLVAAYEWLIAPSSLPNWSFVLLGLLLLPSLLMLIAYLVERKPSEPTYFDYYEDTLFNLRWRWSYAGNSIVRLNSFCPDCDYQVMGQNSEEFVRGRLETHSTFFCECCNKLLKTMPISSAEVGKRMVLTAQQKIRTGAWKDCIQMPSNSD